MENALFPLTSVLLCHVLFLQVYNDTNGVSKCSDVGHHILVLIVQAANRETSGNINMVSNLDEYSLWGVDCTTVHLFASAFLLTLFV